MNFSALQDRCSKRVSTNGGRCTVNSKMLLKVSAAFFLFFCLAQACLSEIIPAERRTIWKGNAGVPGGIPNRTTIYANVSDPSSPFYCDPTGVKDCTTNLSHAVQYAPADSVIYMGPGTYLVSGPVAMVYNAKAGQNGQTTLRGAGMGKTILKLNNGFLQFGSAETSGYPASVSVTAGATQGSTVVTVSDTSGVTVGAQVIIRPSGVQPYEHTLYGSVTGSAVQFQFRVVSKTSTTVTLSHPLPLDLSNTNPTLLPYHETDAAHYWKGQGIEDLTFDMSTGDAPYAVRLEEAWGCWMKNVEIKGSNHRQVYFYNVCASEIRRCYIHDARRSGPNTEGMDFAQQCSWNLIEDNIFIKGGYPQVIFGDASGGCNGNVVAYNFFDRAVIVDPTVTAQDLSFNHGPHNMFNLAEGNVMGMYESDGYYGSNSHDTFFRNWVTMANSDPNVVSGFTGFSFKHYSNYMNVVGNVIGNPSLTNGVYSPTTSGYSGKAIFELGYPNGGNIGFTGTQAVTAPPNYNSISNNRADTSAQLRDLNVEATILRHGNYDYVSKTTNWDSGIDDHALPQSLYLTGRPIWWPPTINWPAIGPDLDPMTGQIPAQIRFLTASITPSSPTNLRISSSGN